MNNGCHFSYGGLAQLARALAWHARGHRFDPDILHSALQGTYKVRGYAYINYSIFCRLSASASIFDMLIHKKL